uniref:response regulator transcription factor n=1 Tax=Streptomyces scabiei TaxID=1930 RepID=UPI000E69BDF2|nr:response regulator transcription factor [Streptomyces scabiei]
MRSAHRVETVRTAERTLMARLPDGALMQRAAAGLAAACADILPRRVYGSRVVVLTGAGTRNDVVRAMEAGARGYILKAGPPEELFRAVRAAAAGGMGLAPEAAGHLAGHLADPGAALSEREIEVVRLLALGRSNRAIAAALHLTEATIKTHLVRVYRKLGTENRASTVSEAVRRGLLELG